MAEFPPVATNI